MKYSALVFLFIFQGVVFTQEIDQSLNTVAVDDEPNGTLSEKGIGGREQNDTAVDEEIDQIGTSLKEEIEKIATQMDQAINMENDTQIVQVQNDTQIEQESVKNDTIATPKDDNNTTFDDANFNPLSLGSPDEDENCTDSGDQLRGDMGPELGGQEGEKSNSTDSGVTTPAPAQQQVSCPYGRRRQRPRGRLPKPRTVNNYFIFTLKRDRRKGVTVDLRCFGGHHCSSFKDRNGFDPRLQLNNPYSAIFQVAALRIA